MAIELMAAISWLLIIQGSGVSPVPTRYYETEEQCRRDGDVIAGSLLSVRYVCLPPQADRKAFKP